MVRRSVFNSAPQVHVLAGIVSAIFHSTGYLISGQNIRSSLIARDAKERMFFHVSINLMRRDAHQLHTAPALRAGRYYDRRGGLCCGVSLDHRPNLSRNVPSWP